MRFLVSDTYFNNLFCFENNLIFLFCLKIFFIPNKKQIAGAAAFWGYSDGRVYMFGFCAVVLFLMGIMTRLMKPCLVKKVNPLEMGGYILAGKIIYLSFSISSSFISLNIYFIFAFK
jgi:hypothetical protein